MYRASFDPFGPVGCQMPEPGAMWGSPARSLPSIPMRASPGKCIAQGLARRRGLTVIGYVNM